MRALLPLLLALGTIQQTSGFFLGHAFKTGKGFLNAGMNGIHRVGHGTTGVLKKGPHVPWGLINKGVHVGHATVGVVVDPSGWWTTSNDDHGHAKGEVAKCPAVADIIFVVDTSSSMNRLEYNMERDFAIKLTEHFTIGPGDVRIGAITFSDKVYLSFHLNSHTGNEAVRKALQNTAYLGGGTKTYLALDYIRVNRLFSTKYGGREQSSKIVCVLTDGQSDNQQATSQAAAALRDTGVKIVVVAIGSILGTELTDIATDDGHVYQADGFNSLSRIELRVADGICSIPETDGYISKPETGTTSCPEGFQPNPTNPSTCIDENECETNNPCQQKCVNLPGKFRCACNSDHVISSADPTKCKPIRQCTEHLDIIFLLDQSGSIGLKNFKVQKKFVAKLTEHFVFGNKGARFGGVLFSSQAVKLFDLDTYPSRSDVTSSLLEAEYSKGGTQTHLGLNYIVDQQMFSAAHGGRDNSIRVVIVLTDGMSSRPEETKQAAARLKSQNIRVMAVGVGDQVDATELNTIASSSNDVFVVSDFEWLDYIEETLADRICPGTPY